VPQCLSHVVLLITSKFVDHGPEVLLEKPDGLGRLLNDVFRQVLVLRSELVDVDIISGATLFDHRLYFPLGLLRVQVLEKHLLEFDLHTNLSLISFVFFDEHRFFTNFSMISTPGLHSKI
jgi:hypothetical protein